MEEQKSISAWEYHVDTDFMLNLNPVGKLSRKYRSRLLRKAKFQKLRVGDKLYSRGEQHYLVYILSGEASLFSSSKVNKCNLDEPIFSERQNDHALITQDSLAMRIDRSLYDSYAQEETNENYNVEEISLSEKVSFIFNFIIDKLKNNKVEVPALHDVAIKLDEALKKDNLDLNFISDIVELDHIFSAKIITQANSAFFIGMSPVFSMPDAIARLGISMVKNLAIAHATGLLFKSFNTTIKNKASDTYQHSIYIASLCYLFAERNKNLDKETALLVGLLHDIGVIPILYYVEHSDPELENEDIIDDVVKHLKGTIGTMILSKWGFPASFLIAAEDSEKWNRYGQNEIEYCDLVIVSHWCYKALVLGEANELPPLSEIPAFRKLGMEYMTEDELKGFLHESSEKVKNIQSLLQ